MFKYIVRYYKKKGIKLMFILPYILYKNLIKKYG